MTTKRIIRQWRLRTGIPVAALILCAALVTGCSHNDDAGVDSGDPVAVQFTATVDGLVVPSGKIAGTRNTIQEFTGVTHAGVPYRDYTDADGFATRAFYPGSAASASAQAPKNRTADNGSGQTEWASGDAVGIFMLNTGGNLPGGISSDANNVEYTASPDNPATGASFAPADAGKTIYYPQSGAVDFVAYYPYGSKGTNNGQITDTYIYKVSVSDQSTPAAIDVLYAKAANVSKSTAAVALTFDHKMSRITLNVEAGDGIAEADVRNLLASGVSFEGMPVTAELALQDGTLTAGADLTQTFSPLKAGAAQDGADATFSAILVPQPTGGSDRTVTFTVAGKTLTWIIPNAESFEAGNHYIYPVTVKLNDVEVGEPTITKWEDHGNGTGTVETPPVGTVLIPAGTFDMGQADITNAAPVHRVTLSKDFYMGKYPVTKAQFTAFLNAEGVGENCQYEVKDHGVRTLFAVSQYGWTPVWDTNQWISQGNTSEKHPDDVPMIQVTWYGAKAYSDWVGGRLPTEAEWEYACRAGTPTAYSFGDDATALDQYAWYDGNSDQGPGVVGTKQANSWGLYDMHGNVFEWCSDRYGSDYYSNSPSKDPTGPETGNFRVLRGGSWSNPAQSCRSAYRNYRSTPDNANDRIGFRVVFVP